MAISAATRGGTGTRGLGIASPRLVWGAARESRSPDDPDTGCRLEG